MYDLKAYYSKRAREYDEIYARPDPIRKAELLELEGAMCQALAGRNALEVACGTGYWTERLAGVASRVVAIDASAEMLAIAAERCGQPHVSFELCDAYDLASVKGRYSGACANFWFSHVPKARISEFLAGLHEKLDPGAHLFIADNNYQDGIGGELMAPAGSDDTYKRRTLNDGSQYIVLKNYFHATQLSEIFIPFDYDLQVHVGECYWWVSYTLR